MELKNSGMKDKELCCAMKETVLAYDMCSQGFASTSSIVRDVEEH